MEDVLWIQISLFQETLMNFVLNGKIEFVWNVLNDLSLIKKENVNPLTINAKLGMYLKDSAWLATKDIDYKEKAVLFQNKI